MQSVFNTKDDDGGCDTFKIDVAGEGQIVLDENGVGKGCTDAAWMAEISVISASSAEEEEEEAEEESRLGDCGNRKCNGHQTSNTNRLFKTEAPYSLPLDHEACRETKSFFEDGEEDVGKCASSKPVGRSHVLPTTNHRGLSSNRAIERENGCHFTIAADSLACPRRSPRQTKTVPSASETTATKRGRGRAVPSEGRFICNRGRGGRYIRSSFGISRSCADPLCGIWFNKAVDNDDDQLIADEEEEKDLKPQLPLLRELALSSTEQTKMSDKQARLENIKNAICLRKRESNRTSVIVRRNERSESGVSNVEIKKSFARDDAIEFGTDDKSKVNASSSSCENDSFSSPEQKSFKGMFWRRRRTHNANNNQVNGSYFSVLSPCSTAMSSDDNTARTTACVEADTRAKVSSKFELKRDTATKTGSVSRSRSYLKRELSDLIDGSIKVARIAALTNGIGSPANAELSPEQERPQQVAQVLETSTTPSRRNRREKGFVSVYKPAVDSLQDKKSGDKKQSCLPNIVKIKRRKGDEPRSSFVKQSRNAAVRGIRKLRGPCKNGASNVEGKESKKSDDFIATPRATKCKAMQKITELVARKKRAIRMKLALAKRKKTGDDQLKAAEEQRAVNITSSIEAVIRCTAISDLKSELLQSNSDSCSSDTADSVKSSSSTVVEDVKKDDTHSSSSTVASVDHLQCEVKLPQLQVKPIEQNSTCSSPTGSVKLEEEEENNANKTKRPIGRPRIHRPPQLLETKPIRLSRNGRRLGRPPTRNGSDVRKSGSTSSESDVGGLSQSSVRGEPPSISPPPPKIINLSILGSKTSSLCPQYLETSHSTRSSVRQTECAFRYREIALRKHDNFIQIVLTSTTRVKNGLNVQVLRELKTALVAAKTDMRCHLVLLNGTGSVFCSGIDLISLVNESNQSSVAEETATALKEFSKTVLTFPKPLVAAVNGAAVGLGVTMLPLFDLVYASDKATFYTPYGKLGQIPEGGATFSLPLVMGYARANGLLLSSRRLTATEALECGLVTQVLWPATFMEEVIPRVQALASQSLQTMGSTKALIRYHSLSKLEVTLDTECRMLSKQWTSKDCIKAIREFLQSEEIV